MKKDSFILVVLLGAALLVSAALLLTLVRDYRLLRASGAFQPPTIHSFRDFSSLHMRRPPRPISLDEIQSWMTFDYLNNQFHLPASYLMTVLNIHDSTYPNVTIGTYAKRQKLNVSTLLTQIKNAINAYQALPHQI